MKVEPGELTRTRSRTKKRARINVRPWEAKILLRLLIEKLLLLAYQKVILL